MIYEEKVLGEPRSNQCATRRGTKGPKVEEEEKKRRKFLLSDSSPTSNSRGLVQIFAALCHLSSSRLPSHRYEEGEERRGVVPVIGQVLLQRDGVFFFCVPPSRNPIRPFESLYFHWFKKKPRTSSSQLSPPGFSLLLSPLFFSPSAEIVSYISPPSASWEGNETTTTKMRGAG